VVIDASGDELRDAARLARESAVVSGAVTLAHWMGASRRRVTAGQVLRKADVPAAGAALGVDVPARLRTMADIRALHRPWCAALAAGLLQVGGGWVTGGPALAHWPPSDPDLLSAWLAALRAVCTAESSPQDEDSVRLLAMALLAVLGEGRVLRAASLWEPVDAALRDLCDRYDKASCEARHAADRYYDLETGTPLAGLMALLTEFGAVVSHRGKPAITALGRWAAGHLAEGLPGLAGPGLSASEMIAEAARFSDEEQRDHVAWGWLAERQPAEAAREILTAAEGSIDQVAELKVSLAGFRPPIWRRLQLPVTATLADLHDAIQVLFGWDGDHLHLFEAGKQHYSDPFVSLDGTGDEQAVRVRDVLTTPGGKIGYTYDFGTCWEHEITLDKTVSRDPGQNYPVCVAYKCDSPVEYWSEDDPEEPEPYNLAEVNRKLAALGEAEE
jgi:hypothetical protein